MIDLKLENGKDDLVLFNNDLQVIDGIDYIRQKIILKIRLFKGENFLNTQEGIPYHEAVFTKNVNVDYVEDLFKSEILSIPEVEEIVRFEMLLDPATRDLQIDLTVVADGSEISISEVI